MTMTKITESLEGFLTEKKHPHVDPNPKTSLLQRARAIIKNNHGVLYRSSIGILKTGIKNATQKEDFTDLIEYVPKFEKLHVRMKKKLEEELKHGEYVRMRDITLTVKRHTKAQLEKELTNLEKESMELMDKWCNRRRPDERTQWKAQVSNRADSVARRMLLVKDALQDYDKIKSQTMNQTTGVE